jgi:hypothetical protein
MTELFDQPHNRVERATQHAAEYFSAARDTAQLLGLIFDTVLRIDWIAYTARRALDYDGRLAKKMMDSEDLGSTLDSDREKELTPNELAASDPGPHTQALMRARQPLLQLFLGRAVDNFQTYIVSMIREILRKRPEILSNSRFELEVRSILGHGSIDSLVDELIERKVDSLSYGGFEDLKRWCEKQGILLAAPAEIADQVIELIATRNLIAHNRGRVDQKYFEVVKAARFALGEVRVLSVREIFGALSMLNRIVHETDQSTASGFGLESVTVDIEVL